jgi:hypothetical protein
MKMKMKMTFRLAIVSLLTLFTAAVAGCTVLSYTGPSGERFSRSSLGSTTAISSLAVETGTNGVRKIEMQGYQSDSNQALGTVTEAAVRAALRGAQ